MNEEGALDDSTHKIADSQPDERANNTAGDAQESGFQAKEGIEVSLAIAGSFEHGDFDLSATQQNLHSVDDADTADEERQ